MAVVDLSRCRVEHPGGIISNGRVLFLNGAAAVWVENKRTRSAERVLYTTDATYEKQATARVPNRIVLSSGEEWKILQISGGCGCGSVLKSYSIQKLLEPDFTSL